MKQNQHGSVGTNGYTKILETYNKYKYPIINNQINPVVFPWSMQRDVDAIDSMRFYTEPTSEDPNIKS